MNYRSRLLNFTVCCGLLLVLSVSCQYQSGITTSSTATQGPEQVESCGQIDMRAGQLSNNGAPTQQVETCFWQAYQNCIPAALTLNITGVDTVTTHNFTLQSNAGQCLISDTVQFRVVPARTPTIRQITCAGLSESSSSLVFSACGDLGDITIPASYLPQRQRHKHRRPYKPPVL